MLKAFSLNFNAKGKAKYNAKASLKNAKGNCFFEFELEESDQGGEELPDWGLFTI